MVLGLKRLRGGSGNELKKLLVDVELPTIPAVVSTTIEKTSAPDCDLAEVSDILVTDPGLSARLLSIANSAAYAPRNPINGVRQAVMMLGRNHLESLLITLAAGGAANSVAPAGFDMEAFWTKAAWRAGTAAMLAEQFDRVRRTENFTASLLGDIAVPILAHHQPAYLDLLTEWQAGAGELIELERAAFGWDHIEVAGWMFDEWGFPPALRTAVLELGRPENPDAEYPIVAIVSVLGTPGELPDVIGETAGRIEARFGMAFDQAVSLIERAGDESGTIARTLS